MDKLYELAYHENEEKNWWFVGRRKAVLRMLEGVPKSAKIVDIGCSGGALLLDLKTKGYTDLHGVDFSPEAITLCEKRGLNNAHEMDGAATTFPDNTFDVVVSSDSLEHIEDDSKALKEWLRILKPGGKLYLFVPAHMYLWSSHDEVNHHFRRYSYKGLKTVVTSAGFKIKKQTYWNFSLFFPVYLVRKMTNLFSKKEGNSNGILNPNSITNKFLVKFISTENKLFSLTGFPIGVSLYVEGIKTVSTCAATYTSTYLPLGKE